MPPKVAAKPAAKAAPAKSAPAAKAPAAKAAPAKSAAAATNEEPAWTPPPLVPTVSIETLLCNADATDDESNFIKAVNVRDRAGAFRHCDVEKFVVPPSSQQQQQQQLQQQYCLMKLVRIDPDDPQLAFMDPDVFNAVSSSPKEVSERVAAAEPIKRNLNLKAFFYCSCDAPCIILTSAQWDKHRATPQHKATVRRVTEQKLAAMMENFLFDDAEKYLREHWGAPHKPVISSGRVSFDVCAEHSQKKVACPSYQMFINALVNGDAYPYLSLEKHRFGFHGTNSNNLQAIMCGGLDPKRRSGQVYGNAEYTAACGSDSISYSKGGDRMFIFLILEGPHFSVKNNNKFLLCNNPIDLQHRFMLPLLLCSFDIHTATVNRNEADRRNKRLRGEITQLISFCSREGFEYGVFASPRFLQNKTRPHHLQLAAAAAAAQSAGAPKILPGADAKSLTPEELKKEEIRTRACAALDTQENVGSLIFDFIMTGPPKTPLEGAELVGTLLFPVDYPISAPKIYILTPNGRFPAFVDVCLGVTEEWNPLWDSTKFMLAFLSVLTCEKSEVGSAVCPPERVAALARESRRWNDRLPFVARLRSDMEALRAFSIEKRMKALSDADDVAVAPSAAAVASS